MSSTIHPSVRDYHLSPRSAHAGHASLLARLGATLRRWRKRMNQKHALALLNERDWHDMGMSQSDVQAELNRPFWREPPPR